MSEQDKRIAEAEELLESGKPGIGFAKNLFFGKYADDRLPPYPDFSGRDEIEAKVAEVRKFVEEKIDPDKIDREADIPTEVIRGLGEVGVLGWAIPQEAGGQGLDQRSYCRVMEIIGGRCAGTAVFVNAHHSIGVRALVLFGTQEQQEKWLPTLATGEDLAAFALTEPQAGSDAGNVQTMATPTEDGTGFILNGEKRYITNASIAQVLTVMARTPVEGSEDTKITAFLVTPDMEGFEVTEARMEKVGIRGTATARLAFKDMFVPKENVLGEVGKGLKVALTTLDFGRTTFGASCTGAAKFCVEKAIEHAGSRVQFGLTLGEFELVKEKLAYMGAGAFAMEACTYQTAALIDSGEEDYMVETAMLKVWSTDVLWRIINDTIQLYGGKAYFCDEPFERMMRDARINTIGEGANDVLRGFIAMMGIREVGTELQGVMQALKSPFGNGNWRKLAGFAGRQIGALVTTPEVPVKHPELTADAASLGRLIEHFGSQLLRVLRINREKFEKMEFLQGKLQYLLARLADAATELYVCTCVLKRLDYTLGQPESEPGQHARDLQLGRYYLLTAKRRIRRFLADLWNNDDEETTAVANMLLGKTS